VVALVLVGIGLCERGERTVEAVARAEILDRSVAGRAYSLVAVVSRSILPIG
jgi:hypothetical protein